jgi:hypothetical protein
MFDALLLLGLLWLSISIPRLSGYPDANTAIYVLDSNAYPAILDLM